MLPTSRLNLARKYRPQALDQVIGQPVAVQILSEALKTDRIAPAYLFSGPRGIGKTTCARIFARAVSCIILQKEKRPCGECRSCLAQLSGQSFDLIEIDGASHTGVDDVRSIIEALAYRPSVAARVVYIIDEVHMLSNSAFNALLKSLEEPPPHILFLFATTEPEKIPETILSRVQRIEMQRVKEKFIIENLHKICGLEKINVTHETLEQVARSADGSLRDAQTLLEQLTLLSTGKEISSELVDTFLGTLGTEQELELLEGIAQKKLPFLLEKISLWDQKGKDLVRLTSRLLQWIRALLLTKATHNKWKVEDFSEEHLQRLLQTYSAWSVEDLDQLFEIFWIGLERLKRSEMTKIALEVLLIRACRIIAIPNEQSTRHSETKTFVIPNEVRNLDPSPTAQDDKCSAQDLLLKIKERRPHFHALLKCSEKIEWKGFVLEVSYPPNHFALKQLSEKILRQEFEKILEAVSQGQCHAMQLLTPASTPSSQPLAPPSPRDHFMKEAKNLVLQDETVKKAATLVKGKIESIMIEGIKHPS